jgi:bifunctional ADP-heptose synthase (sugar kinase/adenylyltransferase)
MEANLPTDRSPNMSELSEQTVELILAAVPRLTIGVLGDLFLDRYLDLDASLTEPSLETGLDAYQVVRVRACPGAAGTVVNNLVALGVGRVVPLAVIGDDGEGYELRQALAAMPSVDTGAVLTWPGRRTPTYTKPMLHEPGQAVRELNRLDIHNRLPLPAQAEERLLELLTSVAHRRLKPAATESSVGGLNGLVVLDQVSHPECGVVTTRVREQVSALGRQGRFPILADSRERIGLFRDICLKPNQRECQRAVGHSEEELPARVMCLCRQAGAAVYCTRGNQGVLLGIPGHPAPMEVRGYLVTGPTDPVGAGDSTSAGIICALASGVSHEQAAAFGNLVASITVQQLGTTGTATPEQVRQRFRDVANK